MPDAPPPTPVFDGPHAQAFCHFPERKNLIVVFDNWRGERDGFPPAREPGFFTDSDAGFLWIHSARNDWLLNPDLPALRAALHAFTERFDRVSALGFSMGGHSALLLSRALRLNQVLLVSPQSSIFPDRAPFETRYLEEAAQLDPAQEDFAQAPRKGLRGVLLYDPRNPIDRQHKAVLGSLYPRLSLCALPFGGHPALKVVAEAGLYRQVQAELLRPRIRPRALLALHKEARRHSARYREKLTACLAARTIDTPSKTPHI